MYFQEMNHFFVRLELAYSNGDNSYIEKLDISFA